MGAPNFKPCPVLFWLWSERAASLPIFPTPAQAARSNMRIRYGLFVTSAVAFSLCLALPAEAAKKKKQRSAATVYATSHSGGPGSWGTASSGPMYNGPDYLGQDPDINIRAYILKDLSGRYGGTF
jgi:hypothetical protein